MLAMLNRTSDDVDSKAAVFALLILTASVVSAVGVIFVLVNLAMNGWSAFGAAGGFASLAGL